MVKPEVQSWKDIYQMIAPHGSMLKALLVPPASQAEYYQGIINTALGLGFKDPALLFGLLWHAPHGEARQDPEKRDYLQEFIATARCRGCRPEWTGRPGRINQPETWRRLRPQPAQEVLDRVSGP